MATLAGDLSSDCAGARAAMTDLLSVVYASLGSNLRDDIYELNGAVNRLCPFDGGTP
jgi:hypothetical protein